MNEALLLAMTAASGGGGGGGGSSDFTTCTVTIVNNSEDAYDIFLPQITEDDAFGEPSIIVDAFSSGMQSTDVFTRVLLYKGKSLGGFSFSSRPSQSDITTSGSISYDYTANFIIVTGDGTLTIG